jgi:hypothetical protein
MREETGIANKRIGGFAGIVPLTNGQYNVRNLSVPMTYIMSSTMMMTQAKLKFQWNQSS